MGKQQKIKSESYKKLSSDGSIYYRNNCYSFAYKYTDNNGEQWLTIKIYHEYLMENPEFSFTDDEAKEIYELLISGNDKEIQEFIDECLQEDDIPTMSQLAQNGEI